MSGCSPSRTYSLSDEIRICNYNRICFFFFQAEDGIRDYKVTGVQTCALPISFSSRRERGGMRKACGLTLGILLLAISASGQVQKPSGKTYVLKAAHLFDGKSNEIGRASCRGRV